MFFFPGNLYDMVTAEKQRKIFTDISGYKFSEVDGKPTSEIMVMHEFSGEHNWFGEINISKLSMTIMAENFRKGIVGLENELPIDYFHEDFKQAAGWIKKLELKDGDLGAELWATVQWTPKGAQMIKDGELKYFSPSWAEKWEDSQGAKHQSVLFGGGLTNIPFLSQMPAIKLSNKFFMKEEGMTEDTIKLAQANEQLIKLQEEKKQLEEQKLAAEKQVEDLAADKKKMEDEMVDKEAKASFDTLVSGGKAIPALEEWFKKYAWNKAAIDEYAALAPQIVEGVEAGSGGNPAPTNQDGLSLEEKKEMSNYTSKYRLTR